METLSSSQAAVFLLIALKSRIFLSWHSGYLVILKVFVWPYQNPDDVIKSPKNLRGPFFASVTECRHLEDKLTIRGWNFNTSFVLEGVFFSQRSHNRNRKLSKVDQTEKNLFNYPQNRVFVWHFSK